MTNRILDFSASGNEALTILADSVRQFCETRLPPRRLRKLREAGDNFDLAVWRDMVDAGWTAISLPEELGGLGLGPETFVCVNYELGRVCAGEPLLESATTCASLLATSTNNSAYLRELVEEGAIFTSPNLINPPDAFEDCVAERLDGGFKLNGCFSQVPNCRNADYIIVPVVLDTERSFIVVKTDAKGISIEPVKLADHTHDGCAKLDDVFCSESALLAFNDIDEAISHAASASALGVSAYLLGLSESLLEQTLEYMRHREQFGKPIGTFQSLQHRTVDWYLQLRLSAAAIKEAITNDVAEEQTGILIERMISRTSQAARLAAREAIQMHGAIGYTLEYDLALYTQRALVIAARYGLPNNQPSMIGLKQFNVEDSPPETNKHSIDDYEPDNGDWNSVDDQTFRTVLRHWIAKHYPEQLRHYPGQVRWKDIKDWYQALLNRGWVAPSWPREHGGMALDPSKLLIYVDEMESHGVARAPDQGIVMVGPVLMSYGNEAQREQYLGPTLRGEYVWCQGYSEPNAGSDLASLNTRAELVGDEFIVNGHKIWTTHGLDATHMYCLVRTNSEVKPQAGISFVLIDLDQPGIDIRPIPNLSGDVDFCEVFLTDVRVPTSNLIGELNNGWGIAKALLGHERLFVGSPKLCRHALSQLRTFAEAKGLAEDSVFVSEFSKITRDVLDLEALYTEFADQIKRGETPGTDVAILKIGVTETYTVISEMMIATAGEAGGVDGKISVNGQHIDVLSHYYNARPAPIYAGSNEIQRNIIAKHVLGLPS